MVKAPDKFAVLKLGNQLCFPLYACAKEVIRIYRQPLEALYENKLSVVYEDLAAARETLNRVREFVACNPTVYMGTHTPLGYENLAAKRIVDLNNPPQTLPVGDITYKTRSGKYVCSVCGYVYDPLEHDGVAFEDLPDDWRCPRCKQPQTKFNAA